MAWTCECGATFDGNVRIGQSCPSCLRIVVGAEDGRLYYFSDPAFFTF